MVRVWVETALLSSLVVIDIRAVMPLAALIAETGISKVCPSVEVAWTARPRPKLTTNCEVPKPKPLMVSVPPAASEIDEGEKVVISGALLGSVATVLIELRAMPLPLPTCGGGETIT